MQHIKTPMDLISLTCIAPADVQQAIDTAFPFDKQGFILWSDTAPDVSSDSTLAYFFWGKTVAGVKPVTSADLEVYYYNGTAWELIPLKILPGSITLADFDLTGSSPLYIIQVNAGGTALMWTDIISAITNNTIPPIKLLVPNNTDTFILSAFAGTKAFTEISAFFTAIVDNLIPITKLKKGAADALGLYLRTKIDGSAIEWARVDVANLDAVGYTGGQSIRRNPGNTGWEPFKFSVAIHDDGSTVLARYGSDISYAHGLPTIPPLVKWYIVCDAIDVGFAIGAEVDVTGVYVEGAGGTDFEPLITPWADTANVHGSIWPNDSAGTLQISFGGAELFADPSKWHLRCKIFSFI